MYTYKIMVMSHTEIELEAAMAKKKDKTDNDTMICFRIEPADFEKLIDFIDTENPKAQGFQHTKSSYARHLFYIGFEKELRNWKERKDGKSKE